VNRPTHFFTPDNINKLAGSYRAVVTLVGFQLLVTIVPVLLMLPQIESLFPVAGVLLVIRPLVLLITLVLLPIFSFRVFDALGSTFKLLWAVLSVIPIINLFVLLWLNSQASSKCREAGVPVGLFGPKSIPQGKTANSGEDSSN
jgi:hypothetical protein